MQQRPPVRARNQRSTIFNPDDFSIPPEHPVLGAERITGARGTLGVVYKLAVFRMHMLNPVAGIGKPFPRRIPEQRFDLRTDEEPFAFQSQLGNISHRRQLLDQTAIEGLSFRASPFVLLSVADVYGDANAAGKISVGCANWRPVSLEAKFALRRFVNAGKFFSVQRPT